jgi:NAD(P)H-hydrate epimerase
MPLPVISVAQMREWERATWATGQTERAVIARVGEAVARRALTMTKPDDSILLLAGKGHNGDDVRAMQPHLADRRVRLIDVNDPITALPEVSHVLRSRPKLIVDGLFGIGLNRPLDAPWANLIEETNRAGLRVLAVDVPSGLDAETGHPLPVAIRAALTMTVGAPKHGFFAAEAVDYIGRLEVANAVGLVPCVVQSDWQWTLPEDFSDFPPPRSVASHKGSFGHLAIVAGSIGYHGASVLAARGGQRARPGLVTLFTQPETYVSVAAQLQAVMVETWSAHVDLSKFTAVLFGPGLAASHLSPDVRKMCQRIWRTIECPLIVDASALDWLEETPDAIPFCRVITPHPGEAARLLSSSTVEVQKDRPAALRALSKKFGDCWAVLKGHHTLIGRAEGEIFVNGTGDSGLAQGGTGDLLAGFITGWLAQPLVQRDPLLALRYAIWEHGAAADRLSVRRENWIVEELAEELGSASPEESR